VIIGSGSGETATLAVIAAKTKKIGATLGVITIYPDSTIARQADIVVQLHATTAKVKTPEGETAFQPGGNTFEQSLLLLCDAMVMHLLEGKDLQDRNAVLMEAHANLE